MNSLLNFTNAIFKIVDGELNIIGDENGRIYYKSGNTNMYEDYRAYFRDFEKSVKREIAPLKANYLYLSLPDDLLDTLSNIEIQEYPNIKAIAKLYPGCKSYTSLEDELDTIRSHLTQIEKYGKKINSNAIILLDDDEKKQYQATLSKYDSVAQKILQNLTKN